MVRDELNGKRHQFGDDPLENIKAKCEQYQTTNDIGDPEFHAILGFIYDAACKLPNRPAAGEGDYVDIVFDGPPSHESGRFVEVENAKGQSIRFGEWVHRPDGFWVLRIKGEDMLAQNHKHRWTSIQVLPRNIGLWCTFVCAECEESKQIISEYGTGFGEVSSENS